MDRSRLLADLNKRYEKDYQIFSSQMAKLTSRIIKDKNKPPFPQLPDKITSEKGLKLKEMFDLVDSLHKSVKHKLMKLNEEEKKVETERDELEIRLRKTIMESEKAVQEGPIDFPLENFAYGYFKIDGEHCPLNSDALEIEKFNLPIYKPWLNSEFRTLEQIVRKYILNNYLETIKASQNEMSITEKKLVLERANHLRTAENFLTKEEENSIDWTEISEQMKTHSPEECQKTWNLWVRPTLNHDKFTVDEVKLIIKMAEQKKDWNFIAEQTKSRSPLQCFYYFRSNLYKGKMGPWSKPEENKLKKIMRKYTDGIIPWATVMCHFEDRSLQQVYHKWYDCLSPEITKGKFTETEDKLLVNHVETLKTSFPEIAKLFKNRSSAQLRSRYETIAKSKTAKKGEWSFEEDQMLLDLVKKFGESNWSEIASSLNTRNRTQIRQRYTVLKKKMDDSEFNLEWFHQQKNIKRKNPPSKIGSCKKAKK